MGDWLKRYFDLYSEYGPGRSKSLAPGDEGYVSVWRQLLVYMACLIGVLAGPFVTAAIAGHEPSLGAVLQSGNHIFWSAVIAGALLPAIYKLVLDPMKPLIVQMAFALVAGFIAQKIVPLAIDVVSKAAGVTT